MSVNVNNVNGLARFWSGNMLTEKTKKDLVERIKAAGRIDKILLFGSEAAGTAGPESDIDLLVVLANETMPVSFRERSANYLQISRAIREIEKKHPIDLLVYTRPEFEKIKAGGSLFVRRVLREGIELQ
jgi:predicted nucleotidyltransferase